MSLLPANEAFPVFAPYGDGGVLTKRGTYLRAVAIEGADFDGLTRGDLALVGLVAAQVAEQLPVGASVTQYAIHRDLVPVSIRDRADPLRHRLSKAREDFLNRRGLARTWLYHVYEFADDGAATASVWGDLRDLLGGGIFEARGRAKLRARLRHGSSLLLSRDGMQRLARDAGDTLDRILGIWEKLGPARPVGACEFWALLRTLATLDASHLIDPAVPMPDDDLDVFLPSGDIEPVMVDGATLLKLHGAAPRYARIGSVIGTPADPVGWLSDGPGTLLRLKGDVILAHHFRALSEIGKARRFGEARAAIERTRMSLINMIKGETSSADVEWRPKHKEKLDALARAEAAADRWGTAFTTVIVPGPRPDAVAGTVRAIDRALTGRGARVVWESVGLPGAWRAAQPGGADATQRRTTIASSRHGALSLTLKSRLGQPAVADLKGEEAMLVLETSTGEPFHLSWFAGGRAFVIATGPVRSGKTYFKNTAATHALKYGGFIRSVDIDPGGKCVCDVFSPDGRGYLALGEGRADGGEPPGLNPFISQAGPDDLGFRGYLAQLLQLLLQANDTDDLRHLTKVEQQDVDASILAVMDLPERGRSLPVLFEHMGKDTRRKFARWMEGGLYHGILSARTDAIGPLDRPISTWNLAAFRDSPAILKPVLFDLFFRVTRSFENPAWRDVPKLLEIDEAHHALSIPAFRDYIVAKIRTWGKSMAGITLWSQSPVEYGRVPDWPAILGAASTLLFMADGNMIEDSYRATFPMLRDGDIEAIRRLVPRREVYVIQPELDVRKVLTLRVDAEQHAVNTSHPVEAALRDRLIREHGLVEGLALAAREIARLGTSRVEVA